MRPTRPFRECVYAVALAARWPNWKKSSDLQQTQQCQDGGRKQNESEKRSGAFRV
jgi:hypothetical protein